MYCSYREFSVKEELRVVAEYAHLSHELTQRQRQE